MNPHRKQKPNRRSGKAITEWFCILGFVTVVILFGLGPLGKTANTSIDSAATGAGDPAELLNNPILKGNNGLGNGYDPQPHGTPPVNDGEGTSPGNPGNRG